MSAVVPVQYLADVVVLLSDAATGSPVLAVIIEPQLRDSKCRRLIRTGHPGFDLAPIVIDSGARQFLDALAYPEVSEADRRREDHPRPNPRRGQSRG
jgi:hypothetical protein